MGLLNCHKNFLRTVLSACFAATCWGETTPTDTPPVFPEPFLNAEPSSRPSLFDTSLPENPYKPRNFFLTPLGSFLLPGLGQWMERQPSSGLFYSGIGALSAGVAVTTKTSGGFNLFTRDNTNRTLLLSLQTYQAMGGLSAYASFRSSVRSQQPYGKFTFLKHEETVGDLFLAPFHFSYILRPTAFIPLGIGAVLAAIDIRSASHHRYSPSDAFFTSAFSYNAATHEEAVFRGWLMPVGMNYFDNYFWSNTAQALVFAAAHIGRDIKFPIYQFAMGWYLGYLSQRYEWTLSEGIFIHAWWDVLAFSAEYLSQRILTPGKVDAQILLPTLILTFN